MDKLGKATGTKRTDKVAIEIEELDEVVEHSGVFLALFAGSQHQVVATETPRLVDMAKGGVDRDFRTGKRDRAWTTEVFAPLVSMPLVYSVSGQS